MPTSELYNNIQVALDKQLPAALTNHIEIMGLAIVGIVQSMSSQMGKIARAMPSEMDESSKEQRLRRFLDNDLITQATHYQPLVRQALGGLVGQRVNLLMDRVLISDSHNILVVSVGFRRRSIPLVWLKYDHRGSSNVFDQKALIEEAAKLLPERVRISVHGDSEFRSTELFTWLRERDYDAMLGVDGRTYVYNSNEPFEYGKTLNERVPGLPKTLKKELVGNHRKSPVLYLENVYLGQENYFGPINVISWWQHDTHGKIVLHTVMTNLPATKATKIFGGRRMWIETVFRDLQSGGFDLDKTGIKNKERMVRLLILIAIAYLWLVSIGRWVVKRGYRRIIDDGTSRNWQYSLFQMGVGWLQRGNSFTKALPVLFYLYL